MRFDLAVVRRTATIEIMSLRRFPHGYSSGPIHPPNPGCRDSGGSKGKFRAHRRFQWEWWRELILFAIQKCLSPADETGKFDSW